MSGGLGTFFNLDLTSILDMDFPVVYDERGPPSNLSARSDVLVTTSQDWFRIQLMGLVFLLNCWTITGLRTGSFTLSSRWSLRFSYNLLCIHLFRR